MVHDMTRGMHWIGYPAGLKPIIDYGSIEPSDDIQLKIGTAISGGRRVRRSRGRALRSWTLTIPAAHADQVEPIRTLATATLGPYQFISAEAQVSNILTPERSVFRSLLAGSLSLSGNSRVNDPGVPWGWTTLTAVNAAAVDGKEGLVRIGPAPTPPAAAPRPVTVSCLLSTAHPEGAWVSIEWLGSSGNQVGTAVVGNTVTGTDSMRRSTATGVAPWGAAACRIAIRYAEAIAHPQVTWTAGVVPEWTVGNGADRVEIAGLSRSTDLQVPDSRGLRRADWTVTLVESGVPA